MASKAKDWYFSNPTHDERKERLKREAEEDLRRHLASQQQSGRQRSSSNNTQETTYDSPAVQGRTRTPASKPATPSANPLLGLGEKEVRKAAAVSNSRATADQQEPDRRQAYHDQDRRRDSGDRYDDRRPVPSRNERRVEEEQEYQGRRYTERGTSPSRDVRRDGKEPRPLSRRDPYEEEDENYRSRYRTRFRDDEEVDDRPSFRRSFKSRFYDDEEDDIDRTASRRSLRSRERRRRYEDEEDDYLRERRERFEDRGRKSSEEEMRTRSTRSLAEAKENDMRITRNTRLDNSNQPSPAQNKSKPATGMVFGEDNDERLRRERAAKAAEYAQELKQQMSVKKDRDSDEREKRRREDMKLEKEMMEYNPFGRGGAGAPLRDESGNLITNTKLQAKVNALSPPSARQSPVPQLQSPPTAASSGFNVLSPNSRRPPGGESSLAVIGGSPNSINDQRATKEREQRERYMRELEDQVRFRKERENQEKAKLLEEDRRKDLEIASYNPWGRVGAGAPLLDQRGNVIPKTTAFHKQVTNPQPPTAPPTFPQGNMPMDPAALLAQLTSMTSQQNPFPNLNPYPSQMNSFSGSQANPALGNIEALLRQFLASQSGMSAIPVQNVSSVASNAPPAESMTSPKPDTSFHRGAVNMENLPEWQKEEMMRKQKQLANNQDELKRQIEERNRLKELELQKERDREQKEADRIEKERRELEERYKRESTGPPIPTLAGKKTDDNPFAKPAAAQDPDHKPSTDSVDAVQRYLQAQAEAEALKKNKFKHKRAAKESEPSSSSITVSEQRSPSPPLPAARASSPPVPAARSSSPPLPTLRKKDTPSSDLFQEKPETPSSQTSSRAIQNRTVDERPKVSRMADIDGGVSSRQEAAKASPVIRPRKEQPSKIEDADMDRKTQAVLDQLSAIKQDLERERQQIQQDLQKRKAGRNDYMSPISRPPPAQVSGSRSAVNPPSLNLLEKQKSLGSSTGSPILDRILASIKSAGGSRPASQESSAVDAILSRQQNKLMQQEQELDQIRYDISPKAEPYRPKVTAQTHEQLRSSSAHVPLRQEEQDELRRSIESLKLDTDDQMIPRQGSQFSFEQPDLSSRPMSGKKGPNVQPHKGAHGVPRRDSPASTLDLDALDRQNEARLQRLSQLREYGTPRQQKSSQDKESDLINDFLGMKDQQKSDLLVDTIVK